MNKHLKQLLWLFIEQAETTKVVITKAEMTKRKMTQEGKEKEEKAKTERKFCALITQKVLPLLRKIYPDVCVEYPCPVSENFTIEERERYFRVLYFGGDFLYWQSQELSLLQLRNTQSYKQQSQSDEPKILYQRLHMFERIWEKEFRDFLRKKTLYGSNSNKKLSHEDEMRDLTLINLRMEQNEIDRIKNNKFNNIDFNIAVAFPNKIEAKQRDAYNKRFLNNEKLTLFCTYNSNEYFQKNTKEEDWPYNKNIWYTKQNIIDFAKAIASENDSFLLDNPQQIQLEPVSVGLAIDEQLESNVLPKTLFLLVDWGFGITERLILWHNDKKKDYYAAHLIKNLLQENQSISSIFRPIGYNADMYLKRLGLTPLLQRIFGINKKTRFSKANKTKVFFNEITQREKKELLEIINELPFYGWLDDLDNIEMQQSNDMADLLLPL